MSIKVIDSTGKEVLVAGKSPGIAGVSSFNGRAGAVTPQAGDYTAEMVGAVTLSDVTSAIQAAVLDSWEGSY